jgi:hypothetical protein
VLVVEHLVAGGRLDHPENAKSVNPNASRRGPVSVLTNFLGNYLADPIHSGLSAVARLGESFYFWKIIPGDFCRKAAPL